jgi:hypothetical protein
MFEKAFGAMRLPPCLVGLDLRRRYRAPLYRVCAPQLLCSWYVIHVHDRIVHVFEEFMLEHGLLNGGTCGWRSAVFGRELLEIVQGM